MTKLEELYSKRNVFVEYNMPIPDDLAKEIAREEHHISENAIDNIASFIPYEIDQSDVKRLIFVAEYVDGKLTRFGAGNVNLANNDLFSFYTIIGDDDKVVSEEESVVDPDLTEEEQDDDSGDIISGIKRKKSIGFSVKFADGKVIKEATAQKTMIEALKYMGLSKASKYRGDIFKGFPLVGKKQRITNPPRIWQKEVDGWWIYTNMGNSRAIVCIKGVADMLNIPIDIKLDNTSENTVITQSSHQPKGNAKGKRTKYSINGGEPSWKNRTVWNVVRNLLSELPNATFKEISDFFPKALHGSFGVVATVEDIEKRAKYNLTEHSRWFLDPSEILTSADGVRFAVSNEWGDNFENFRSHVIKEFGWTITEA